MNRTKKEALKKYREARDGLTVIEVQALDAFEAYHKIIYGIASILHETFFMEEYDFYFDSGCDAKERSMGKNPMSEEYIEMTNKKRVDAGFDPMTKNGYAPNNHTMQFCQQLAQAVVEKRSAFDKAFLKNYQEFKGGGIIKDQGLIAPFINRAKQILKELN